MEILLLFLGIVIGLLAAWLYSTQRHKKVTEKILQEKNDLEKEKYSYVTQNQVLEQKLGDMQQLNNIQKSELSEAQNTIIQLNRNLSSLQADHKNLQQKLNEQQQNLQDLQQKFAAEFRNLANEIFEDKSKKFTDQNKINLGELLNPLKERIVDFEKKIDLASKESLSWNAALKEQITGLRELNLRITNEAQNLTKALKGESKVQGGWGEIILESILEKSGLCRDREFLVQQSHTTENGKRLQPDVIINLPEDKHIIIDAKVSLSAYERYCNLDSEEEKITELKKHLLSIKSHVKNLSSKNYQQLYQLKSLDFVLMFVPVEPAFSLAIQNDVNLFNDAYDKNIVIVSPATLLATLRTIASIWRQEYQNQNAMEIARQGGDLYDKFVGFVQDLQDLGKKIDATQAGYNNAMKKLTEGRGNLVSRAERIKKLGANVSKSLPESLLDNIDATDE
ncbi:MAG: DNA recombination protein RmuC [Cyclobacteriaceae bacterium]